MIKVVCGSITSDELLKEVDAVVNATNPYMIYGSGICGAIFKKASKEKLENYCKTNFHTNMCVGEIRVTPGFDIPCDIIFAQGPRVFDYEKYSEAESVLLQTYVNLLNFCVERGYKKILLPSLGTGVYGFKNETVAKNIMEVLKKYNELEIFFVHIDEEVCKIFRSYL